MQAINTRHSEYSPYPKAEGFEVLSKDIPFLDYLSIERLTALGMTSKKWKEVTEVAPFWKMLCKRAFVFPESKPSLFTALENSNTLALNCFLASISRGAAIRIAIQHLKKREPFLKDAQVLHLLQQIIENKNSATKEHLQAEYIKAVFMCQDRNPYSTYKLAFNTLQEARVNNKLRRDLRLGAEYHSALMQAKGLIYTSDYEPVAKNLFKIIYHEKATPEMQAHASYYLADLVLSNCSTLMSRDTALKLMKTLLKNTNLSKELREGSNLKIAIGSEASFEDQLSNSSSDFTRSLQMKKSINKCLDYSKINQTLQVNGKDYSLITSKTTNFFGKHLASYGASIREVIILDPEESILSNMHFKSILQAIEKFEKTHEKWNDAEIFSIVLDYVRTIIFNSGQNERSKKVERFISSKKLDKDMPQIRIKNAIVPAINIDEFLGSRIGVCRHHAMITAYILDGLTKQTSLKTGKPFLYGIVQIIRDNLPKRGAHAWVTMINSTSRIHIDTLWNKCVDFSTSEGIESLKLIYGDVPINNQLLKVEKALKSINTC
jgi:hypothetical protein